MVCRLALAAACCAAGCLLGVASIAAQDRIPLPARVHVVTVQGERVSVTYRIVVGVRSAFERWPVEVEADLGELRDRFPAIAARLPFPRDNCKRRGENLVTDHKDGRLEAGKSSASIELYGRATLWECRSVAGRDRKAKLAAADYDATVPVTMQVVPGGGAIRLVLGEPDIRLSGRGARLLEAVLRLFKVDLNRRAQDALERSIEPEKLMLRLPPALRDLGPRVESARFDRRGDAPILLATLTITPPTDPATLIRLLWSMQ